QAGSEPAMEFVPEKIAVYPIQRFTSMGQTRGKTTPVYSLQPDGPLAVPTGRVFVPMGSDRSFAHHQQDFRESGYAINHAVPCAANAGWLRSVSSAFAASLPGWHNLWSISGMEHAEPQMLRKAVRKR